MKADIGMIGLAVMGSNLALNMEEKGFTVAVYNREPEMTAAFAAREAGKRFIICDSLAALVQNLKKPRAVMMMIRAGAPVDAVISQLLPLLEAGDVIIDGGNSNYQDTIRRAKLVESQGMLYVGTGVSGGEEGARHGPSMMPGGSPAAWQRVQPIFQAICAKAEDGLPCCEYMGENGAGHYVKMVHNGIEYGDMQLICEAYQLMRDLLGMRCDEISDTFRRWNGTELNSYLMGISADILSRKDADGTPLVERILDTAGQKGTGKWTVLSALDAGIPLTLIGEAVFARCLSAMKEERLRAAARYPREIAPFAGDRAAFLEGLRQALYAAKIVSYAQGYQLMRSAAQSEGWHLDYGSIARIWRGGCIIRSAFLQKIMEAYGKAPDLENLLLDDYFHAAVAKALPGWRQVAAQALLQGVPAPALTAALTWLDGYTSPRLPANLLQAQRDYFGAHTYERVDAPRGQFFHTDWNQTGSAVSGSYSV